MEIYRPQNKIILASSFDGLVSLGAKECGIVSLAVYKKMVQNGQLRDKGQLLEREESKVLRSFQILRPLAAGVGDFLTLLQVVAYFPSEVDTLGVHLQTEPWRRGMQTFLGERFNALGEIVGEERAIFKAGFYAERERMEKTDYLGWVGLQEPISESIDQFRQLKSAGFKLYFVTSDGEESTYRLCTFYGGQEHLRPSRIDDAILAPGEDLAAYFSSLKTDFISRECVIGRETVESGDRLALMHSVARKENISPAQVWSLQGGYNRAESEILKAAGFENQFVIFTGHAFLSDYENAHADGLVVVERGLMAQTLSGYARENGF